MSVFRKRNLLVALATFVIGVSAFAAIWGVPRFLRRNTSINSSVSAYLLDDQGEVDGLLLASGDQLHFSTQTGAIVASQIKVGDTITASGRAGSQSNYGREVRVEQISANGRQIVEGQAGPPHSRGPHGKPGSRDGQERGDRRGVRGERDAGVAQPPTAGTPKGEESKPTEPNRATQSDADRGPAENALLEPALPLPEIFKAAGTIQAHLVNGHGEVDGLLLSGGEQVRFSPHVGELVVTAEQGTPTQVSVEGHGVHNQRGTVIRPTQITVGNQTIALGR